MIRLERKYLPAAAAFVTLIAAVLAIFLPIIAAFDAAARNYGEARVRADRIQMLEERLQTERRAFADEFKSAGPIVRAFLSRGDAYAAPERLETVCARLADAFASKNIAATAPCRLSQSPLGEGYVLHVAEIAVLGDPNDILTAADSARLDTAMFVAFRLAVEDARSKNTESMFSIRMAEIGAGEPR